MKKSITALVAMLTFLHLLKAQDTILKINGDEIKAKVIEVNKADVRYHRSDNPDGPVYTIDKSEIALIKYANGTQDMFNENAAPAAATNARDSDDVPGLFSTKISDGSAGNLTIDNPKKLSKIKPDPEWSSSEITESTIARFYLNAGFSEKYAPARFFETLGDKTSVSTSPNKGVFVAIRMFKSGKVLGTSQFYINGTNVMFPTGFITRAIFFKDAEGVEYHSVELATAICQDLAKNGSSTVGIMYANGNMSELIFTIPLNNPAMLEFNAVYHPAGSFNPSDYNIKFYPNPGLNLSEKGTVVNRAINKYRVFALEE